MTDINRVNIIGRCTREPELKTIGSGASVCTVSIAVNRSYGVNGEKREEVSFFNVVIWGKAGEAFAKYGFKGQRVSVDGRLQQRRWQDNDGNSRSVIEIVSDNFQFLSFKDDNHQQKEQADDNINYAPTYPAEPELVSNDDLPF
ncbi:MAG: single-stranded DNA-binding protein [Spirochaetes bacterium]|jgi:single-strand DNA-binding protein|nr:single-stranded DNA-binding protein [Spirochaetota bacterium]